MNGFCEEIKIAIQKLKNNRAPGIDGISSEMLKFFCDDIVQFLKMLFNNILETGDYPEMWAIGLVKILFKKGKKDDLNNYRDLTILSVAGKFLTQFLMKDLRSGLRTMTLMTPNKLVSGKVFPQ